MQSLHHETEKRSASPSLFDVHKIFLELENEFTAILTLEPVGKVTECDAIARALRRHLYTAKVHLLCTNVDGALSEIRLVRSGVDKLKSLLLPASTLAPR